MSDEISIHLGSSIFVIPRKNIMAHPGTTLANSLKEDTKITELVFDRSPESFDAIRNFYLYGTLHIPSSVCSGDFREELVFWSIPESKLESCCVLKYRSVLKEVRNIEKFRQREARSKGVEDIQKSRRRQIWKVLDNQSKSVGNSVYNIISTTLVICSIVLMTINVEHQPANENATGNLIQKNSSRMFHQFDPIKEPNEQQNADHCKPYEKSLAEIERLNVMEEICKEHCTQIDMPDIRFCGRRCPKEVLNAYFGHKTFYLICQECDDLYGQSRSKPAFIVDVDYPLYDDSLMSINSSTDVANITRGRIDPDFGDIHRRGNLVRIITNYIRRTREHLGLRDLLDFENVFVVFYTTEFILRFITCPSRVLFVIFLSNIFDFVSIAASLTKVGIILAQTQFEKRLINILMIGQMARVFRLLRSIKHMRAFRVLSYAAMKGCQDLLVIVLYVVVGMVIFGTLMFFVEPQETFPDIGQAVWWSILTMTTVGYGDVYPMTIPGKVIACICALYGIVMLALTIPLFAQTFQTVYQFASLDDENEKDVQNESCKNAYIVRSQ